MLKIRSNTITMIELVVIISILGASIVTIVMVNYAINTSIAASSIQRMMDKTLAFKMFASSYDCIAGDCLDAESSVQSNMYMNGNGDGVVNVYGSLIQKNEVAFIEEHLTRSRLFRKVFLHESLDYTKIDLAKILQGGSIAKSYISTVSSGGNFYHILGGFSQQNSINPDVLNFTPIQSKILAIIDSKADDSKASTGEIKCYNTKYTVKDDVIVLPMPTQNYEKDCVLSFNLQFNSKNYSPKNEDNS